MTNTVEQPSGFLNYTVSVSGTISLTAGIATEVLPYNPNRIYAHLANNSNKIIYVQYAVPATAGAGIPLNSGAVLFISGDDLWKGTVSVITTFSDITIDVFEGIL